MKTKETTEEVSSHLGEKELGNPETYGNTRGAGERPRRKERGNWNAFSALFCRQCREANIDQSCPQRPRLSVQLIKCAEASRVLVGFRTGISSV
jgi:hypothetical protein